MNKQCFEGNPMELGNPLGKCCCNCKHQVRIVGHPFNKTQIFNGPINKVVILGCAVEIENRRVVAIEQKHGICEMHNPV